MPVSVTPRVPGLSGTQATGWIPLTGGGRQGHRRINYHRHNKNVDHKKLRSEQFLPSALHHGDITSRYIYILKKEIKKYENMFSDLGMQLMEKVDWNEVKETAKFYYTDSTTTLNLYPALIISIILLFCE